MPEKCKKGEIWRIGYSRKTSKRGSIKVRGKCIKATSQTGKKTSIIGRQILKKQKKVHEQAREKFGTPVCRTGEIIREGYKTKKNVWVAPTCIKSDNPKQERLFYLEPDRLAKYGYANIESKSDTSRHNILREALSHGEKPLSVKRRLIALSALNKNTKPKLSRLLRSDAEWLSGTKEYKLERQK